ncbi:MAG: hypothetical protein MJ252_10175 [archaeon]|nr:hypothetical protein [archaeon]
MSERKFLEMMDSIPKFETFSRYSNSLDKKYKKFCLKHLIHELKYPKKFQEYGSQIVRPLRKDKYL